MKNQKPSQLTKLKLTGLALLVILLSACSTSSINQPPNHNNNLDNSYDYVLTVNVTASDQQAEIEQHYEGDTLVWQPDAGFAVLGLKEGEFTTLSDDAEQSHDVMRSPELQSSGFDSWAGGWDSWAGGWDSWAGGWDSWAGGDIAPPNTLSQNQQTWDQVNLAGAQQLAPRLGSGIKVAVIDTGIDLNHPAFSGKLAPADEWKDFIDNDDLPLDEGAGHGTAVAGVILQVAPNVTILPIRILDQHGYGDLDDLVLALAWAIQQDVDIIHLSLGTTHELDVLKDMLKWAKDEEIAVVASAGNYGQEPEFPARYGSETIAVGSVNQLDLKSSFSAHGDKLDVVAPGEVIYTIAPDNRIAYWSGTSFAAPMITGSIALVNAELSAIDEPLKPSKLESIIAKTSDEVKEKGRNKDYKLGDGRLNIEHFLFEALDMDGKYEDYGDGDDD